MGCSALVTWESLGFGLGKPVGSLVDRCVEKFRACEDHCTEGSADLAGSPFVPSREQRDTFAQGAAWCSGKEPLDRMGIIRALTGQEQFLWCVGIWKV